MSEPIRTKHGLALRSQRIYATKEQFRLGNGRYSFSGTVYLLPDQKGYILRKNLRIPVVDDGGTWKVAPHWQTPQLSLFEVA